MSSTFRRGLALIEIVGTDGPIGISELARRLGADKASVSRMVTAAAQDGWLTRTSSGVELGPRLPILGHHTELASALREAQPVLDTVAGVTGLFTHLYLAVGSGILPVLAAGRPPAGLPTPPRPEIPIWTIAAGRAIATLMSSEDLETLLPSESLTFPAPLEALSGRVGAGVRSTTDATPALKPSTTPQPGPRLKTRSEFLHAVDDVRSTGIARDHGEVHPLIHCLAVPWDSLGRPAAISVIGHVNDLTHNTELIEAVLRTAATPGATRERIVVRAAEIGLSR